MKRNLFFLILLVYLVRFSAFAQYPSYFSYTIENGAPSNEIYCILEDKEGYIWIGCDAGVYRFNGISFEHFSSPDLTARSATGLCQSPSGRIYGYNFNNQIFYIENNHLTILENWNFPINGITSDQDGNIWISCPLNPFKLNEKTLKWNPVKSSKHISVGGNIFTDNIHSTENGNVLYHNGDRIIEWSKGTENAYSIDKKYSDIPVLISKSPKEPLLFGPSDGIVFHKKNNEWVSYSNPLLSSLLTVRKATSVIESDDGILWINTHSGLIRFDKKSGEAELLFDQISFSNCIKDREGNFWFTTLHNGIMRIPSFAIRGWNAESNAFGNDQLSHISTDGETLFFAGTTGSIGSINIHTNQLKNSEHELKSDFGMFYYDSIDKCIYFNKMNQIFQYKNGKTRLVNNNARPIKAMLHNEDGYFILSSQGMYFANQINEILDSRNQLLTEWFREIVKSPFSNNLYMASNKGLYELEKSNGKWIKTNQIFKDKQIISIASCSQNKKVYFLTFEGIIYSLSKNGNVELIMQMDEQIRTTQLRIYNGQLFLASNKGILIINGETKNLSILNKNKGLSSNNIRGLVFTDNFCWAATGKGIQKIPLDILRTSTVRSRVLFRDLRINSKSVKIKHTIQLNYNDVLTLVADGLSYNSNGDFLFAYRIKGYSDRWITVPGSVGKIVIPKLPSGDVTLELKLIDHEGKNSENTLNFQLKVIPPIWERWWFYVLIVLVVSSIAFLISRQRMLVLRKKQQAALRQLQLENELRLTQQNALKSQMNPHFLFNVLNSIKGYIYENDKKNAARYLSDFSNLVRKVLDMSSLPSISLEKEIETLDLYIKLEAMLLQNEFSHEILIDDNVDVYGIQIPSLVIQPYVENSFKHGLRHKNGPKELNMHFKFDEANKILIIEIDDNGIGRSASALINHQLRKEHQSFATGALEKRLELLNHAMKDVVGVEIVDKFDAVGNTSGTKVYIRIHV
jgi:ligand-binding sensor domain-containing protein